MTRSVITGVRNTTLRIARHRGRRESGELGTITFLDAARLAHRPVVRERRFAHV
jgi:hypothetical protein